jgi:hypothetical protein
VLAGAVAIAVGLAVALSKVGTPFTTELLCVVIPLAVVVVLFVAINLKRRSTKFRVTNTVIETERGVLSKRIDVLQLWVSIRPNAPDIGGTAVAAAIPCAAFRQPMLPARGSGPNAAPAAGIRTVALRQLRHAVRATDRQQPRGAPSRPQAVARVA